MNKKMELVFEYVMENKPLLAPFHKGIKTFIQEDIERLSLAKKTFEQLTDHFILDYYYYYLFDQELLCISGLGYRQPSFFIQKNKMDTVYQERGGFLETID